MPIPFWRCPPEAKSKSSVNVAIGFTPYCRTICAAGCRRAAPSKCECNYLAFCDPECFRGRCIICDDQRSPLQHKYEGGDGYRDEPESVPDQSRQKKIRD